MNASVRLLIIAVFLGATPDARANDAACALDQPGALAGVVGRIRSAGRMIGLAGEVRSIESQLTPGLIDELARRTDSLGDRAAISRELYGLRVNEYNATDRAVARSADADPYGFMGMTRAPPRDGLDHAIFRADGRDYDFRALPEGRPDRGFWNTDLSRRAPPAGQGHYKVYLAIPPGRLRELMPHALRSADRGGAFGFKFGMDSPNLLRDDRVVAYFENPAEASRYAESMGRWLREHGVTDNPPLFTHRIDDLPASIGYDANNTSWRTSVTDAIAESLLACRTSANRAACTADQLRLRQVEPDTWLPTSVSGTVLAGRRVRVGPAPAAPTAPRAAPATESEPVPVLDDEDRRLLAEHGAPARIRARARDLADAIGRVLRRSPRDADETTPADLSDDERRLISGSGPRDYIRVAARDFSEAVGRLRERARRARSSPDSEVTTPSETTPRTGETSEIPASTTAERPNPPRDTRPAATSAGPSLAFSDAMRRAPEGIAEVLPDYRGEYVSFRLRNGREIRGYLARNAIDGDLVISSLPESTPGEHAYTLVSPEDIAEVIPRVRDGLPDLDRIAPTRRRASRTEPAPRATAVPPPVPLDARRTRVNAPPLPAEAVGARLISEPPPVPAAARRPRTPAADAPTLVDPADVTLLESESPPLPTSARPRAAPPPIPAAARRPRTPAAETPELVDPADVTMLESEPPPLPVRPRTRTAIRPPPIPAAARRPRTPAAEAPELVDPADVTLLESESPPLPTSARPRAVPPPLPARPRTPTSAPPPPAAASAAVVVSTRASESPAPRVEDRPVGERRSSRPPELWAESEGRWGPARPPSPLSVAAEYGSWRNSRLQEVPSPERYSTPVSIARTLGFTRISSSMETNPEIDGYVGTAHFIRAPGDRRYRATLNPDTLPATESRPSVIINLPVERIHELLPRLVGQAREDGAYQFGVGATGADIRSDSPIRVEFSNEASALAFSQQAARLLTERGITGSAPPFSHRIEGSPVGLVFDPPGDTWRNFVARVTEEAYQSCGQSERCVVDALEARGIDPSTWLPRERSERIRRVTRRRRE